MDRDPPSVIPVGVQVLGIVLVTLLAYASAYEIDFHQPENRGIIESPVVRDLGVFAERMLSPRGLLQRPLSVLSYALNYAVHGERVAGYHVVNVAIHLANALLVFAIARQLGSAALLAGLIFALHPLGTSCASQIFGRNYSLACLFVFLGLLLYLRWRETGAFAPRRAAALGLLYLCALLSKQTLVFFPLLLAWYEIGRAEGVAGAWVPTWLRSAPVLLLAASAAIVGAVLLFGYAIPLSRTAAIPPMTFFWSQLGNALTMAGFFLLPYRTALLHDLPLYASPWHALVGLGAALVVGLVVLAWRERHTTLGFALGAFLLCLLPTNTILPKNEIVHEWRFYPSLLFFALAVAELALRARGALARRLDPRVVQGAGYALLGVWLALFAHSIVWQNRIYRTRTGAREQVLARYPNWADALNNLATERIAEGRLAAAQALLERAHAEAPEVYIYLLNLATVQEALGNKTLAENTRAEAERLRERYGARFVSYRYR